MITTSQRRRAPVFEIALVLSLLLHLAAILLYGRYGMAILQAVQSHEKPEDFAATNDTITLEKKTVPRPAVRRPAQPVHPAPPVPRTVPKVVAQQPAPAAPTAPPVERPTPLPRRREIAHFAPRAEEAEPPAAPRTAPESSTNRYAPPPAAKTRGFSEQQIAAMNQQFSQAISQSQSDLTNVAPPKQPPSTMKHYDMIMSGTLQDVQRAQGVVDTVYSSGSSGRFNWHYVHVTILYADGYTETIDVPWPFVFPSSNDPIEREQRRFLAPPPPDGYVLPHPFPLSRFVCSYYKEECAAVIESEKKNGGNPAGN
jgi:hypothetical protein